MFNSGSLYLNAKKDTFEGVRAETIRQGESKKMKKNLPPVNRIHGHNSRSKRGSTYDSRAKMIQRCTNPNSDHYHNYHNYGGRGIEACERWRTFQNFLEDMGERPAYWTLRTGSPASSI